MTWKNIKSRQLTVEARWIVFFSLCILAGVTGDCLNIYGHPIFYVENLDGVSLVILQIQGTIDTLSIAILSLLGGRVSESYMGIPLVDFTLNRKPGCLKQRRIIILLIFLLSANIFFHLAKLYNTVLASFLISEGLICFSVKEIYEVFSGHIELGNEIESYLLYQIKTGTYGDKLDLLHKFCDEWKSIIANQSEPEFETYQKTFDAVFKNLFLNETPNSRTELQKCIYHVIHASLRSENPASKKRGLRIIKEIYSKAWAYVITDKNKALSFSDGFYLFHTISDDLRDAIEQLPVAEIEQELRWFNTAEYVLLINYWVAGKSENQSELQALNRFASAMGYYIAKNRDQEWHTVMWEKPLVYLRIPSICPEGKQENMKQQQSAMLFYYAVSLINSNMLEIIENSLYTQAIPRMYHPVDKFNALLVLKIHCYIYYLAEYESTECISDDIQSACKTFLRSGNIRRIFSEFLRQISLSKEIFNQDLEKLLFMELEGLEFFPPRAASKKMIMETVVRNYVLFITLYLFGEHDPYHLMDQVLSDEMVKYHLPLYLQDFDTTISRIDNFLMLLSTSEKYPHQKKVREKYMALERETKRRLKKIELTEAIEQSQDKNPASFEETKLQIQQYIIEKFSPLISEDAKTGTKIMINCFRMDILSDMSVESFLLEHLNDMASGLINGIFNDLNKTGSLQIVKRSDFQDDAEYIDYLKSSNADVVLGSQWPFFTKRYNDQKIVDLYLEDRKTIFAGFTKWGILLRNKSLQIYVEDVHISIHPPLIKDSGAKYDSERDIYIYNLSGIDLEFEENELTDYLNHKRQIVAVDIQFCIKKTDGNNGDLLLNDSANTAGLYP